jgi:hypothetical protein
MTDMMRGREPSQLSPKASAPAQAEPRARRRPTPVDGCPDGVTKASTPRNHDIDFERECLRKDRPTLQGRRVCEFRGARRSVGSRVGALGPYVERLPELTVVAAVSLLVAALFLLPRLLVGRGVGALGLCARSRQAECDPCSASLNSPKPSSWLQVIVVFVSWHESFSGNATI